MSTNFKVDSIEAAISRNNKKETIYELLCIILKYAPNYYTPTYKSLTISLDFVVDSRLQVIFFYDSSSLDLHYLKRCISDDIEEQGFNKLICLYSVPMQSCIYSSTSLSYAAHFFGVQNSKGIRWALVENISMRFSREVSDILSDCKIVLFI